MSLRGVHISKTDGRLLVPRPLARPRTATMPTSRESDLFWMDGQTGSQSMSPVSRLPACILLLQSSVNVLATDTGYGMVVFWSTCVQHLCTRVSLPCSNMTSCAHGNYRETCSVCSNTHCTRTSERGVVLPWPPCETSNTGRRTTYHRVLV